MNRDGNNPATDARTRQAGAGLLESDRNGIAGFNEFTQVCLNNRQCSGRPSIQDEYSALLFEDITQYQQRRRPQTDIDAEAFRVSLLQGRSQ
jgi:hypothetical protein